MQDQSIKQALNALLDRGETRSIIDKSSAAWRERLSCLERRLMTEQSAMSQVLVNELFLLDYYYYYYGTPDQVSSHGLHLARATLAAAWREYLEEVQDMAVIARDAEPLGRDTALQPLAQTAQTKMDVQFVVANRQLGIQAQEENAQLVVKKIQADHGLDTNPLYGLPLLDIEEIVAHVTKTLPWQAKVTITSDPTAEGGVITAQLSLT